MAVSYGDLLKSATARLAAAGCAEARLDARALATGAFGLTREALLVRDGDVADLAGATRFVEWIERRASGEPVARILGRKEFWSLDFTLGPDTLVPRPDSETVIEAVLASCPDRAASLRILDFGTGTGCLLLALLSEYPNARGLGIDASDGALTVAVANARALGLATRSEFRFGDWGRGLDGPFDVIVSNPPYIRDGDIDGLAVEVARHDPRRALAGGADGLDCYRTLAPDIARLLATDGLAVLEIGQGQAEAVEAIMVAAGLVSMGRRADLGGIERALAFGLRESA